MATTQEFADKVCRRMAPFGDVRRRKMFGEYLVYVNEKPVLALCDGRVFVKKLPQLAALMADAAADLTDEKRRRILGQILYQLGRWIYLIEAADDLKKDTESGNYNPLLYRYHTENGVLGDADRLALAETLDASIERMASAYALYDYGVWTPILDSIFYESLYGIGKAVLDGTYRRRTRTRYGERKKKSNEEAL